METTHKAANSEHESFDKIDSSTNQAAETLGEKGEQLKKTEQQLMKNCRSYIRENPMTSVSIGIAAGFLLSRLFSRP